jgi:ElaB/YqjD/DUF883 family membrane-anchored ribosome-binding protein
MTRSVDELRRDSERSRAALERTVDNLREQITTTAADISHKISPQHVKSEISKLVSHKTEGWATSLKQQAVENPMGAVAVGSLIAVPILRLVGGISWPLLMIGTGLALTSKTVRDRAIETASPAIDRAREIMDDAAVRAQSLASSAVDAVSSVPNSITGGSQGAVHGNVHRSAESSGPVTDTLKSSVASATQMVDGTLEGVRSTINQARATMSDAATAASDAAANAPERARQVIGENPVLIGAFGLAIGALLAASLPKTSTEAAVIGSAAEGVKRATGSAVQSKLEEVKEVAISAVDAAFDGSAENTPDERADLANPNSVKGSKPVPDAVGTDFGNRNPNN